MAAAVEEAVRVLEEGPGQDEETRGAGPLPRIEVVLQRSVPRGFPCLPHLPAVLLSSGWTKLSTATLLASNRLWPSLVAVKGV